ncbi:T9SS type A sorting domain-containing protein [Hyunsoonleella aestuarii]|uniref:Secretion system C-terminal sorting domain-containing protein n=1 Tax=Hyunsoonleella aestuarii TaxID=912802 RepID=A0ABP8E8V4_9FLAO|nr:T9SS type A sorting domain-containing protein [Hyunsoonleella aestuarii]
MKKITLLFLCLVVVTWSHAQCTTTSGGLYPGSVVTILNDGTAEQIAADNWPNAEVSAISGLIIGNTYTVAGTNTTSLYITVAEAPSDFATFGVNIVHGASSVSFTATTSEIWIFWHLDVLCRTQDSDNTTTTIQCTSLTCTCTANSAPDAAVATTPIDNATNVAIDVSDPANRFISGFAWTDNGEATSYDFNIIGVGTATGVSNPVDITYTWLYSTTYSWSITSTNCLGNVTSSTFSFTTEADPALSVSEFDTNKFSVYPNPAKNSLNIKSDISFYSVEIYNQLGQSVIQVNADELVNKSVNISSLNNGIYFMKISAIGREQTLKFVKE